MADSKVIIHTDGSSLGNPGPGGYGIVLRFGDKVKEISAGYRLTTNNRMEILAAIEALRALNKNNRYEVVIYSDSRLLVDAINKKWIDSWQKNRWRKSNKDKVLNVDLWLQLLEELRDHNVKFKWVEGHAGNPDNERCDELCKAAAMDNDNLHIDREYESSRILAGAKDPEIENEEIEAPEVVNINGRKYQIKINNKGEIFVYSPEGNFIRIHKDDIEALINNIRELL
ncbi:MAG: ribonuclease HI [Candidatus Kapaibacterium sp.]